MVGSEAAVAAFCAELFASDRAVVDVVRQPIGGSIDIQPHAHDDALQLALLRDCGGRALAGGRWLGVAGLTALAAYPGQAHGYELRPVSGRAEVTLIKLRVGAASVLHRTRPLATAATSLPESPRLSDAVDRLRRDVPPAGEDRILWTAEAAAVVCCWPRAGAEAWRAGWSSEPAESDAAVQAALSLIESRVGEPPGLDELALAAHLSPRQFSRRFRAAVGRTPHEYVTERRLARAKALLFDHRLSGVEVAERLGFGSHASFTRWFRQHEGRTPGSFRADHTRF